MNPLFHTDFSISDSLKSVRKSVLIYETIIEGMDVSTWCEQNNITKANYYYRLKRVRQMCLDQLPEAEKPAFVELSRLKAERTATMPEVPVMCIKNGHGLSADIFSSVSPQLLRCLVEAFSHVE